MEQNINADHNNDILLIFAVLRGITRRWTTTSEIQNRLASQGSTFTAEPCSAF